MLASERFGRRLHSADTSRYRVARNGNLVIDPMLLWDGSLGVQNAVPEGLVSPDYRVFEISREADPRFIDYLLRSSMLRPRFRGNARGTNVRRNRIARSDFNSIVVAMPCLAEQRKIAAILSSVDETIEKTEAVIAQLDVVKKAMLEELLTRGIPGRHSRFQETEIGEVPEKWQVVRIDEICDSFSGGTPARSRSDFYGGPIPWVKSGEVGGNKIRQTEETLTTEGMNNSPAHWVPKGSTLVAMYGATAGQVGFLEIEATTNQAVLALVPRRDLIGALFLYYSVQHGAKTLLGRTQGSGQPNLNAGLVRGLVVARPPLEEQARISDALSSIETRIDREQVMLAAIQLSKHALSSSLLSGELRVDGVATE